MKMKIQFSEFISIPEGFVTWCAFISTHFLTPLFRYCLEMFRLLYNLMYGWSCSSNFKKLLHLKCHTENVKQNFAEEILKQIFHMVCRVTKTLKQTPLKQKMLSICRVFFSVHSLCATSESCAAKPVDCKNTIHWHNLGHVFMFVGSVVWIRISLVQCRLKEQKAIYLVISLITWKDLITELNYLHFKCQSKWKANKHFEVIILDLVGLLCSL